METEMSYVPQELVLLQVLPRLPVRSLLRFRCVCKTWRGTIDEDDFFHREHRRLQKTSLLLAPQVRLNKDRSAYWRSEVVTTMGLYKWERTSTTLVHGLADHHSFREIEAAHGLAHCHGLVLLPSEGTLRVLNPATRRVLTLPWSPNSRVPCGGRGRLPSHQAFGLGHDPRSNAYKVARFFYRSTCTINYTLAMEIFTIRTDQSWRDIKKIPPYPLKPGQTSTFYKGSLLWHVEKSLLKDSYSMPGFVRLNLEEESFGVVPLPPSCNSTLQEVSSLAELRGELCLVHSRPAHMSIEVWTCNNLDDTPPRWDRRYVIALGIPTFAHEVCPKAMLDEEIVFKFGCNLLRYNYQTRELKDMVKMYDLRYGVPNNKDGTCMLVECTSSGFYDFDVIPFVPSLVRV